MLREDQKAARRWLWEAALTSPDRSIQALKNELGVDVLDLQFVESFEEFVELVAETLPVLLPSAKN